jgi:superfamily II DNA or RNA helicase
VIPTGGGKSGIAALAPYILNTTRVLVITPSLQITNQLAAAFGYSYNLWK